jgi:hypothetical protein
MLPDQDALAARIRSGEVDTILVVFPDVFGRLVGKRVAAEHFLRQHLAEEDTHGSNYLLTLNIEMDPLDGFSLHRAVDAGHARIDTIPRDARMVVHSRHDIGGGAAAVVAGRTARGETREASG